MAPSRKTIRIVVSALLAAILAAACACALVLGGKAAWAQGDDGQKEAAPGFYKGAALPEPEIEVELAGDGANSGLGLRSTGSVSSTGAEYEDIIKQRVNRALSLVGAGQGVTIKDGVEYAVVDLTDLGITDYNTGARLTYEYAESFPDFFYLGSGCNATATYRSRWRLL